LLYVFAKIIEYIARTDLKPLLLQNQSVLQRGVPVLIDLTAVDISSIDTVRGGIPSQISLMV
jgi:hypothetical protein